MDREQWTRQTFQIFSRGDFCKVWTPQITMIFWQKTDEKGMYIGDIILSGERII
jgi:hypothetical protein